MNDVFSGITSEKRVNKKKSERFYFVYIWTVHCMMHKFVRLHLRLKTTSGLFLCLTPEIDEREKKLSCYLCEVNACRPLKIDICASISINNFFFPRLSFWPPINSIFNVFLVKWSSCKWLRWTLFAKIVCTRKKCIYFQ